MLSHPLGLPQVSLPPGSVAGEHISEKDLWQMLREYAAPVGISGIAPQDFAALARSFAALRAVKLEQIQFLSGHVSVQTTENTSVANSAYVVRLNDRIGIEPDDPRATAQWTGHLAV